MEATDQLKRFFRKANHDLQLKPSHISLYLGLLWVWQENNFSTPFKVCRKKLMALAHISSIATYHKCIRELTDLGYIVYEPSYNYYKGCHISLVYRSCSK